MKRSSTFFLRLSAAATTAILVAACGGGGGGSTTPVTDPGQTPVQQPVTAPAGGNAEAGSPAAPQLLAQYQGAWKSSCEVFTRPAISNGTTVSPAVNYGSAIFDIVVSAPATNGSVAISGSEKYFNSANCSGEVIATIIEPSATLTANGTKTIAAGVDVVRVEASTAGGPVTATGTAVSIGRCSPRETTDRFIILFSGGIRSCQDQVNQTRIVKLLATAVTNNSFVLGGNDDPLDSDGYPTALAPAGGDLTYTKQ